ncbi:hypothetical protein ACHAP8_009608 [Fusarium lateritium]
MPGDVFRLGGNGRSIIANAKMKTTMTVAKMRKTIFAFAKMRKAILATAKMKITFPITHIRDLLFPITTTREALFLIAKAKELYAPSVEQIIELPVALPTISNVVAALVHP